MNQTTLKQLFFALTVFCTSYMLVGMESPKRSLYQVLEIEQAGDDSTILNAYNRLAAMHSPADNSTEHREENSKRLKEIFHAFNVLINPQSRVAYDATLSAQEEAISLTAASEGLNGVEVTPPSEKDAQESETELFVCFSSAAEAQSVEGWMQFNDSFQSHLSRYEEHFPLKPHTRRLLKQCSTLLLSRAIVKSYAQKIKDIQDLEVLLAKEKDLDKVNELRRLILSYESPLCMKNVTPQHQQIGLLHEIKKET